MVRQRGAFRSHSRPFCKSESWTLCSPSSRNNLLVVADQFDKCIEINRFDQVIVEPCLMRTAAVFFLTVTGHGDQEGIGGALLKVEA